MAKIPDGSFKDWQDTQIINALEYKRERELIRVAVNDNSTRLDEVEVAVDAVNLDGVQITKITDNTGGVKLSVTSILGDVLAELVKLGKGFHTFYAVEGSKNLPPTSRSIRGFAHFTEDKVGYLYATDYQNNVYSNYYLTDKWLGWKDLNNPEHTQLWSGAIFLQEGQTVTPTKKISDCRNGWILVWSDYNPGQGPQNFDIVETYISKGSVAKFPGAGRPIPVPRTPDSQIIKYVNVGDTKLEGNAGNEVGDKSDVVLRYVLEW